MVKGKEMTVHESLPSTSANGPATSTDQVKVEACPVACELQACPPEKIVNSTDFTIDDKEEESSEEGLLEADLGRLEMSDMNIRWFFPIIDPQQPMDLQ